jgi:hypothetical protein
MKSFPTAAVAGKQPSSSLREILLPEEPEATGDSDYELLCQEDSQSPSAPLTPPAAAAAAAAAEVSGNYFSTAESVTVDDLLEDVDYVDESDMKELKQLFERIKGRVKKEEN